MDLLLIFGTFGTLLVIIGYQGFLLHRKDVLLHRKIEGAMPLAKAPNVIKAERKEQEQRDRDAALAQREWEKSAVRGVEKMNLILQGESLPKEEESSQ